MNAIKSLPKIRVVANGHELADEVAASLRHVRVSQAVCRPAVCEIEFAEYYEADRLIEALPPGTPVSVFIGDQTTSALFTGQVTSLDFENGADNSAGIRIRAHDSLYRLQIRQPVRTHVDFSLAELARHMTRDLGITCQIPESGPVWDQQLQHSMSDLALLTQMSQRCGLFFALEDEVLNFFSLSGNGPAIPLGYGESLLQSKIRMSAENATRSVDVRGWNPYTSERHQGHAGQARACRPPNDLLHPQMTGGDGQRALRGACLHNDDQAAALAQAELDRRLASEITLWARTEGDTDLRPGRLVEVRNLPGPLAGRYVLTSVTHTVDHRHAYMCEVNTVIPDFTEHEHPQAMLSFAEVTQVDDPEGLGRIKVSFPVYDDIESAWLEVLLPAAGRNKGLVALPDVDDRVLVLMNGPDPAQSIVLGGLFSTTQPPDSGIADGAIRRFTFTTPAGQRLCFDDDSRSLRIDTADGSFFEMAHDGLQIHAHANVSIAAPGKSITIKAASIDFESA